MNVIERHECLASLIREWDRMPVGEPQKRERWFCEVGAMLAGIESAQDRERWIKEFARAIHEKQQGLALSVCTYIVQQRVEAAQKGGVMYRENFRKPVAAGGTSVEYLGKDQDEFIPHSYKQHDQKVLSAALVSGVLILSVAFWPAVLGWMTDFRWGVVVGAVGMAGFILGAVAIGVCLGAANLEKRR